MDFPDFFRIVERDRDILNPVSPGKLEDLAGDVGLRGGSRVLDVGSGKGAMLRLWAARHAIHGTGLELNPAFVQAARTLAEQEGVAPRLTFVEGPALDFELFAGGYDVVTCLGASFALGGFREALGWMKGALRPGGTLALGDVYLARPAPPEVLEREGWAGLRPLPDLHADLEERGLELVSLTSSNVDDWDRYTSLMWKATHDWAAANPAHPDRAEVLDRVREGRARYLRFERDYLGWAILAARERA